MDDDPWFAPDKLYHFIICFSLTLLFSTLASHSRYSFLRSRPTRVGSIFSLLAGAAKKAADHLGLFPSAGASFRDGVLASLVVLFLWRKVSGQGTADPGHVRRVLPV